MNQLDTLQVRRLIASHMGPWNIDERGNKILPLPVRYDEKFVHACDYLASRDFLNIKFVDNEIVDSANRNLIRKLKN